MTDLNLIGTTLGRFAILDELGRGGMAVVYRATQTDLDRVVALKILPPALTHDASYVARFRQEARSAARLEHPHIVPIYEVGEANGLHYIAMKYIAGHTVKDMVEREGALPVGRAVTILTQVGEALDYAHRQGVIHRDIKPSNMMITEEGWVYLTDFGLARGTGAATGGLTLAGTVMGTPEYMSPEQAQGLPDVGPPSDIYALGVVLYELLTGSFPFKADTPMAMLAARLLQSPTPPRDLRGDLPRAVEDVVMRALARKPEARFPSAASMVAALRAAGVGDPEPARPQTPISGSPAVGATIRVPPGPPPANPAATPGSGAPYVQRPPVNITQPAAPGPPPAPAPTPAARPHTPGGLNLPYPDRPLTLPPATQTPAPTSKPRQGPSNMVVILAVVGVLLLACIGMFASFALRGEPGDPGNARTAVAEGDLNVALADADKQVAGIKTLPEVMAVYEALLADYPDHPRVLGRLALAASAGGETADAAGYAMRLAGGSDPAAAALGHAVLAEAAAWRGDVSDAQQELTKARAGAPDLALAVAVQAAVNARRAAAAHSADELGAALAPLDGLEPADDAGPLLTAMTHAAMGAAYAHGYELDKDDDTGGLAEQEYKAALDLLPAAGRLRADLGYLLVQRESYDDARAAFDAAVAAGYAAAEAGAGWAYYFQDDAKQALVHFDAAVSQAPASPEGYYGQARLRYDADDYDGAIALMEKAVDRDGSDPTLLGWLGEVYFWRGFNAEGAKAEEAFKSAAEAYERALDRDDRNVFAISGMAWTLQHQEDYDASVERFDEAIALSPEDATLYDGKGWSLLNRGDAKEAEAAFRKAVALDDEYSEAHYHLGRALEDQGRTDEARDAYGRALELDPDNERAREHLDGLGE